MLGTFRFETNGDGYMWSVVLTCPAERRGLSRDEREADFVRGFRRLSIGVLTAGVAILSVAGANAAPTPKPYQHNDFRGFRNILPPAQGKTANATEVAAFQANGTIPLIRATGSSPCTGT
jgi:hypothetical protein